jgi:hypothetical protein
LEFPELLELPELPLARAELKLTKFDKKNSSTKKSVNELSVDEMSVDKLAVNKMSVDELLVDEVSVDELRLHRLTPRTNGLITFLNMDPDQMILLKSAKM